MIPDRSWMSRRLDGSGRFTQEFKLGVHCFVIFAMEHLKGFWDESLIPCPCEQCKNGLRMAVSEVQRHLFKNGFMADYVNWTAHGEKPWGTSNSRNVVDEDIGDERSPRVSMVNDTSDDVDLEDDVVEKEPNPSARKFDNLFGDSDELGPSFTPSRTSSPLADAPSEVYNTHTSHDGKKEIWVERPNKKRFRPIGITNKIMKEVIECLPKFAPEWKDYPRDMKDILYATFKVTYKFVLPEDELLGRKVWNQTCQDRYPESLRNLRLAGLKKNNTSDIAQTRGNPPKGIKLEVWNQFVDYWLSDKFQRRSKIAKANRRALPDAAVHSGGSISFAVTLEKMEKEKGVPVSLRDLYEHTHKKKGTKELISEHAREVLEKLDAGLEKDYGKDPSRYPKFDKAIWLEATRPNKKGRVEGLGGSIALSIDSCNTVMGPSCSQPSQAQKSEIHEMNEKMNTLQKNMENIQQRQEGMQQLLASMNLFFSSMVSSRQDVGASSPPASRSLFLSNMVNSHRDVGASSPPASRSLFLSSVINSRRDVRASSQQQDPMPDINNDAFEPLWT